MKRQARASASSLDTPQLTTKMTSRIEVFYTSILVNPKVRSNTEKVERFLFKIPHQKYDIASRLRSRHYREMMHDGFKDKHRLSMSSKY